MPKQKQLNRTIILVKRGDEIQNENPHPRVKNAITNETKQETKCPWNKMQLHTTMDMAIKITITSCQNTN